jgi:hypothetical protein
MGQRERKKAVEKAEVGRRKDVARAERRRKKASACSVGVEGPK